MEAMTNTPDLMNFIEKYANQLQLTDEVRRQGNNALKEYKEKHANQFLVEDTPEQGIFGACSCR